MPQLRVAVDIGGTFTDVCVFDDRTGAVNVAKVPSTGNPIDAVLEGLRKAEVNLRDVALFSHGTTVATNALITRTFGRAGMVTTRGFRDVIEIRRGTKQNLWDAYEDVASPYVRRRDRLEVSERVDYQGEEVEPLDEVEARQVARILAARGVEAVAICFVNAHANPDHERAMKAILEEELPAIPVSCSSEVLPEIFEHERFSTTVSNAVLSPLVTRYLRDLDRTLTDGGYDGDLLLLHSGGGVMTPRGAQQVPVRLAASGLAAGAIACKHLAALAGHKNAIGLDMGGTSSDISLVADGELRTTNEWSVDYGYPICLPSIEVLTIGAGGGSIAWIDEAGSLRNGPQSAGATPGPACYGQGGKSPTNTDAHVVLGRLGDDLLGGAMRLDPTKAEAALRRAIATRLDISVEDAAQAVIEVANANMADAVRLVSIQRGYDPRDFALVVVGGAGPLHGIDLARELSVPSVLVPPNPGISSALGCLLVDIRHDLSSMLLGRGAEVDLAEVEGRFRDLEDEARTRLLEEGVAQDAMRFERTVDMRYRGQWRSLGVAVSRPVTTLDDAVASFHEEHEREYSFRRDDAPVELYRLSVRALGVTPKPQLTRHGGNGSEPVARGQRRVRFSGADAPVMARVYLRDELDAGCRFEGPAVVDQVDSTTVVPPDVEASVDEWLNIRLKAVNAK